jgi:hypothetical protein
MPVLPDNIRDDSSAIGSGFLRLEDFVAVDAVHRSSISSSRTTERFSSIRISSAFSSTPIGVASKSARRTVSTSTPRDPRRSGVVKFGVRWMSLLNRRR